MKAMFDYIKRMRIGTETYTQYSQRIFTNINCFFVLLFPFSIYILGV